MVTLTSSTIKNMNFCFRACFTAVSANISSPSLCTKENRIKFQLFFLFFFSQLQKQHTLMHRPNTSLFRGQDVNNNNNSKFVSFHCVLSALPLN